ncbi:unnamed protein product [Medioppia subpectinata]|uniref:Mitochondrial nucleoid factor 1 n=1 Tax=Medioppia subpectinata TaxID=1979941 RepID=A0A7R9LRI2_9ACAR|nr:unnamed protein product [Medioppia subpectinata]CAG2121086.1 unnamed protein product [Medioppia subpectinata]
MSSVSALYRRYLLVCNQWSIDTTKSGRDFGTHLRQLIPKLFPNSELTQIKTNELKSLDQRIQSLERLNKNLYFKPSFQSSSASGLTVDECKQSISTDNLKQLAIDYDLSTFDRIKLTFGSIRFTNKSQDQDLRNDKHIQKDRKSN